MKKLLSIVLSLITLLCVAALCACNVTFKGSPSASPAASDDGAGDKIGQDSSSTDVSALMAEIESLQARIDELEADVRYLEKACFTGTGTLYYNMQKWASEEFLQANMTRHSSTAASSSPYPIIIALKMTDEDVFKSSFPGFPEEVDFDNETVVVYCFTDNYAGLPYELRQITFRGNDLSVAIDQWHIALAGTYSGPKQRVVAVRMQKTFFVKATLKVGMSYKTKDEVVEEVADELSKSELLVKPAEGEFNPEDTENMLDHSVYNKNSGLYERITPNTIKIAIDENATDQYRYQMIFNTVRVNGTVFTFYSDKVDFGEASDVAGGNTATVAAERNGVVPFGFKGTAESDDEPVYVTAVIRKGGRIVGYGVFKLGNNDSGEKAMLFEYFAFISEAEVQEVTEQMINVAIEAAKNEQEQESEQ